MPRSAGLSIRKAPVLVLQPSPPVAHALARKGGACTLVKKSSAFAARTGVFASPSLDGSSPMHCSHTQQPHARGGHENKASQVMTQRRTRTGRNTRARMTQITIIPSAHKPTSMRVFTAAAIFETRALSSCAPAVRRTRFGRRPRSSSADAASAAV